MKFRVDDDLAEWIEDLKKETGLSKAKIIRTILNDYFVMSKAIKINNEQDKTK